MFEKSKHTNNEEPLVSVIIPVYNQKDFIERSVDSVIAQTYKNLEIILIDDGSTDGGGTTCDEYISKDARIRVIHQANQGLSGARNTGLDGANGGLIAFLDSDDEMKPGMIKTLYDAMIRTDADIAQCGTTRIDQTTKRKVKYNGQPSAFWPPRPLIQTWEGKDKYDCLYSNWLITVVQWNKLYRREIFDGLRYPAGRIHEDEFVICEELRRAKKYTVINRSLHFYYCHGESISAKESDKKIIDGAEGLMQQFQFFKALGDRELMDKSAQRLNQYLMLHRDLQECENMKKELKKSWINQ